MNKKGFTVIEFMTTFVLVAIISTLLIKLTITLKEIYINGDIKTVLLTKQGNMTEKIYKDLKENNLISLTSCGTNCIDFEYETDTKTLKINKDKKILTYGNYSIKLGDSGYFGTVDISNYENDIGSILNLNIPIYHKLVKGDYGINIIYQTELINYDDSILFDTLVLKGTPISEEAASLVYKDGTCKTDGTTYNYMGGCYIKGASTNNYVWYNGFMWRIMGINQDGTVRLITDENVTSIPYGASGTGLIYYTNKGYIHDWLNDYFYSHLNSTKSIIKEGNYFCSETTNSTTLTTGRTTCTSGYEVKTKVGLISIDEYLLADTASSYLENAQTYWTMTSYNTSNAWYSSLGIVRNNDVTKAYGVRPVINVESTSTITGGNGTATGYYVLAEDKTTSKTGTINNIVTSGEYVKLEGNTYRVVSKDSDGIKLILDGYYTTISTYGDDSTFSTTTGIGQLLNGNVLTYLGLSSSEKLVSTKWYQGTAFSAENSYTLSLNEIGTSVEAKVGMIRVGEMLSGQSSTILTKKYTTPSMYDNAQTYWTMTPHTNTSYIWYILNYGDAGNNSISNTYGVRPVIKVRNDLTINGGTGTWNNPYEI